MSSTAKTEVEDAKQALMVALGDKWAVYLANMKMWFRKKSSKEEFDLESRRLLDRSQTHLHNRFLLAILNKIDAVVPPQSSTANAFDGMHNARPCEDHSLLQQHDGRSGKKRKRSSKSSSERATFAPTPLHEYIASEPASETDLSSGQQQQSVPSIRYAAQELFLPDHGLVLGRLLVGAWENGLASAEDGAVELIVNAVQVLLKNILTATILARKDSRLTGNGTFFYDVGYELKHPFVRNTVTKSKIDDEPMDLDKEITTVSYLKPPPGESLFLTGCEQLYPRVTQKISAYEVYRALQDRNIIPSHSVYSMNIERISSQLS